MVKKTAYEEFFRYHDFTQWLNEDEEISQTDVTIYNSLGEEEPDMVNNVAGYDKKKVRYKLTGGESGKQYRIRIRIVTSNHQRFEDSISLLVM